MNKKWMAAAFLIIPMAVGCGGGGSNALVSEGDDSLGAGFVPAQPAPGSNTTAMGTGTASGSSVSIQVTVTDTDSVYGAAFRVEYDPTRAKFVNWAPGSLLERDGKVPTYQVDGASTPGQIFVGASRTGNVPAVSVTATEPLIVLNFRVLQAGDTPLQFTAEQLFDGQVPPQSLSGIHWFGGTLRAN